MPSRPPLGFRFRAWPGATLSPAGVLRAPLPAGRPAAVALGEVLEALEGIREGSRRTAV